VYRLDSIEALLALYADRGGEHYGENVSQTDHARQCAALAMRDGASDAMIAAALLHDIGHLVVDPKDHDTDDRHETVGAETLSALFPPAVTEPIAGHVTAKRYRCAVDRDYADGLSHASKLSLAVQGGAMTPDECHAFERRPFAAEAITLRGWDDAGKIQGLVIPEFSEFVDILALLH
jgi:[1-hydroxy-2-(trimethylamino)ethyl]phosphonate dioxygenase